MKNCNKCGELKEFYDFHKGDCLAGRDNLNAKKHLDNDPSLLKLKTMVKSARNRAKNHGVPFDLTLNDLMPFYNQTHCTLIPSIELNWANEISVQNDSPSLDRIIPSLGYVKENIQIISNLANVMKNNATDEELRHFIKSVRRDALEYFNIGDVNENV